MLASFRSSRFDHSHEPTGASSGRRFAAAFAETIAIAMKAMAEAATAAFPRYRSEECSSNFAEATVKSKAPAAKASPVIPKSRQSSATCNSPPELSKKGNQ